MISILEDLFREIEHGDKEHRQWLYNKMEEFSNKYTQNMVGEAGQSTLTFGQKAVGLTFNPGGNADVELVKRKYADLIDLLDTMRTAAEGSEKKRIYSVAITDAQASQMWAVKAITWQY